MKSLFSTLMGDHLETPDIVNNPKPVRQIKQSVVNKDICIL